MAAKELPKKFTTKALAVAPTTLGKELLDVSEQLHEPTSIQSKSTPRTLDGPTI